MFIYIFLCSLIAYLSVIPEIKSAIALYLFFTNSSFVKNLFGFFLIMKKDLL